MTTSLLRCLTLLLLTAIAWTSAAQPIDTRCMESGGSAFCRDPVPIPSSPTVVVDKDMWNYGVCDLDGPTPSRNAAWCAAMGGCGAPLSDGSIVGVATRFEQIVTNACQLNISDSGWGQTLPSNQLCWSGPPLSRNNMLVRDFRVMSFSGLAPGATGCNVSWKDIVYAVRLRNVVCPSDYGTRTKANGDLECWKLFPECSALTGNPINLLDGCKMQRELDYRSRSPGGIEVERYYSSAGSMHFDGSPDTSADYWHTTWDRRIVMPRVPGSVLAYAQRADGSFHVFTANGRELLNAYGGGSALLERVTDSAGMTTGWRLTSAESNVENYDATGRLRSMTLRTGWTFALAYGGDGRLASVTDAAGATVTFTYDPDGRLSGFVAAGNRIYRYGYDVKGRLTTVTYPDNAVRTYHYENPDFLQALTGITDENGVRFATWSYDSFGRAVSSQHAGGAEAVTLYHGTYSVTANEGSTNVIDAFGTTRTYYYQGANGMARIKRINQPCPGCNGINTIYTFDANGNVASYTDFNGNKTTYTFDLARNLEISRTEASGTAFARTITTQWHPNYRVPTNIVAPSGVPGINEVTDLAYDAQGNLVQKTIAAGALARQWKTTYNARGQVLAMDGPRTDVTDMTTYTYYDLADPCVACRGNTRSVTNALGHATTFNDYDVDGQPLRVTDANGIVTTSTYDMRGRLTARTVNAGDPAAETTTYDYDKVGQMVKATLPDRSFLRYQFDDAHRLTEIADSLSNVMQYTLDAMGNRIKEDVFDPTDRLVRTRQRVYDSLDRLYNDIGAAGQVATYQHDGNGNLVTTVDPLMRSTALTYDALNRLQASTDSAGGITRYGYDAKDRLVSVKDPDNLSTAYTYDGLGNSMQLASPDTGIATFVPDAQGNTVASTDARGIKTSYSYDALNRQTLAAFVDGAVALEYDNTATGGAFARGKLTKVSDPSGTTTYGYDAQGRVRSKVQTVGLNASAKAFGVAYQFAAGRTTGITYPSGRAVVYAFDANGRVTGITFAGQPVLTGATYFPFGSIQSWTWTNGQQYRREFDADGRIATLTLGPDSASNGNAAWTFGYDGVNRLTTATLPQGETLAYVYDANGNRKQETRAGAITNYGYTAASNRLQSLSGANTKSYSYDAAGNVTVDGGIAFTYDGRSRLTQSSTGHTYSINGMGQRVAKSGPGVVTGTNYYVYDERGRLIGEYDAAGTLRQELIYLADTPVASVRLNAGGGVDIFPIYADHLDTPRVITNQASQKVWEWTTDTFGAGAANENPSGLGTFSFNLRFPGQYYDVETGRHYNYFRDYDPAIGRYVESDPIGMFGGINTYSYVGVDPLNGIDPFGLSKVYGNWCGGDWTGGFRSSWNGLTDDQRQHVKPPIDQLDGACMNHDKCYGQCGKDFPCDPASRGNCFRFCDRALEAQGFLTGGIWGSAIGLAMSRPGRGRNPGPNSNTCCSNPGWNWAIPTVYPLDQDLRNRD